VATEGAVDKMIMSGPWADGLALIFPESVAPDVEGLQVSANSWTPMKDKPSGRNIVDASPGDPGMPLNSPEAINAARLMWGKIKHPIVDDMVQMDLDMHEKVMEQFGLTSDEAWLAMILWKTDLRAAFTLLFFHPDYAAKKGCRMTIGGLLMIFFFGVF
jgi:hypothetical protein